MLPRGNSKFYSPPGNEEVVNLMQEQDIFILPSRLDGLPVSLLESMSTGCVPVISEFNTGIKKVVTPDIGYVLPVGDNQAFADSILALNNNRADMVNKSGRARAAAVSHYNIEVQAAKYFELFAKFRELKKPMRRRFYRYGGWLDYPFCPAIIRNSVRALRNRLSGKQAII